MEAFTKGTFCKLELIWLNPNHRSPNIQNNLAKNVFSAKNFIAVFMLKVFVCISKKYF